MSSSGSDDPHPPTPVLYLALGDFDDGQWGHKTWRVPVHPGFLHTALELAREHRDDLVARKEIAERAGHREELLLLHRRLQGYLVAIGRLNDVLNTLVKADAARHVEAVRRTALGVYRPPDSPEDDPERAASRKMLAAALDEDRAAWGEIPEQVTVPNKGMFAAARADADRISFTSGDVDRVSDEDANSQALSRALIRTIDDETRAGLIGRSFDALRWAAQSATEDGEPGVSSSLPTSSQPERTTRTSFHRQIRVADIQREIDNTGGRPPLGMEW